MNSTLKQLINGADNSVLFMIQDKMGTPLFADSKKKLLIYDKAHPGFTDLNVQHWDLESFDVVEEKSKTKFAIPRVNVILNYLHKYRS